MSLMDDHNIPRPKHHVVKSVKMNASQSPSTALASDPDVNWTNAQAVVEKDFEDQALMGIGPFNFGNVTASGTPHFDGFGSCASFQQNNNLSPSPLEMSWGAFFAKKSPPLDEPQFSSPNNSGDTTLRESDVYQGQRFLTASFVGGQDKFLQPLKTSVPSTQFRNGAFHIDVPQLECVQRFYQFPVRIDVMDENRGIKPQIDDIIEQYLRTQFDDHSRPIRSYVTYHREMHRCTVLLIFPSRRHSQNAGSSKSGANASKDHELNNLILKDKTNVARNGKNSDNQPLVDENEPYVEWVEHFLKFPPLDQILDRNTGEPAFTEIASLS